MSDATLREVYHSMTARQKECLHFMIGEALANAEAEVSKTMTVAYSPVAWSCPECEVVVNNPGIHQAWHDKIEEQLRKE